MKARRLSILALTAMLTFGSVASAQQGQMITPNYKDADLGQVIEAVSQITGKNFIIDPRVRAQVTMLSSTPMSAAAFYQAFLSILQVHGFVAVPAGKVIKIVPDANARQMPGDDLPSKVSATSDEIVTQVIQVQNISAAQLVPILRPLIPQYGHLAAYPASNMLIISDRAANVNRMMRIIQRLDQGGDTDIDVIRLEHASAEEVVRVVNALNGVQGAEAANTVKIVADNRTNSVLLSGDANERLRIRALITHLDTPLESGGDTQVRYLRYADAEKLAAKLKEQAQGFVAAQAGGAAPAAGAASAGPGVKDRDITIWADPETNALIITAPPKIMTSLMRVVDQLDIRRKQVLIEAMLVEVSTDASRDLGVNWVIDGSQTNFMVGLFNQPVAGVGIGDVAAGIQNPSAVTSAPNGLTVGIGRKESTGTNFAAILRALQADGDTNVVSMPSVITLDNEEAKIEVAQEVPFVTGSYATTGGTTNTVNPFTTVERKEVGNILKITPQITDEGTILLKIEQESSGIAAAAQQVSKTDLVTNKRTISTRVLVDNGGMLVLGGLIEDRLTESQNKVPLLGSIPLIGELFRTRSTQKTKTNLMVFIRPRIIDGAEDAAIETNAKYQFMRDLQMHRRNGKVQLMPGAQQPILPELEGPTAPAKPVPGMNTSGTAAPAPTPDSGTVAPAPAPSTPPPDTATPATQPPKGT